MKMLDILKGIYDKIFSCRVRLLKALQEKGVRPSWQKNVLSEWGLISILNGYLVSELNTMTVRQVMHLRKKPGVIYNANFDTLNRIINLIDYLNPQYQNIKVYKSRIIKDSTLGRWTKEGTIQWYHNLGVYIGDDLKPMITENGGMNWYMLDLSELYGGIEDGYYISDIKATIIENFSILYFLVAITNLTGPSKTSIRIYAMASRAFSKLDYTWLLPVDLNSFDNIYVRDCGNSDRYVITTINSSEGSKLLLDIYASDKDSIEGRLRHYISKIDSYGAITEWTEVQDYYSSIDYLSGQFIVSKSYISSYGIDSNKQTYCIFLLTTRNILHLILTTGLTKSVQPTASFSYNREDYGELTKECGNTTNVVWLKTTKGLLIVRNNRELFFYEKVSKFIMFGVSLGVALIEDALYLYRNYKFSILEIDDWLKGSILSISQYSGKGRIAFLHSTRGNGIFILNLSSYKIDSILWMQNSLQASSSLYGKSEVLKLETPIAYNGHGICLRYIANKNNTLEIEISYNSGANWNQMILNITEPICGNFFLNIESNHFVYFITTTGKVLRLNNRYELEEVGILDNFLSYFQILYQNSFHTTIPHVACFVENGIVKFYLTDMESNGIYEGSIAEKIHTIDNHPIYEGFSSSSYNSSTIVLARLWLNNQNLASLELLPSGDNNKFSLYSYEYSAMGALPVSQLLHSESNEYFSNPNRQLLSIGSNFSLGRADYEKEENTSYLHMNPMIYKGYPFLLRTKSSDLYFNKQYGKLHTIGCNEAFVNLFTTKIGKERIVKTTDTDILIETAHNRAILSTSEIDTHHQGIAEYVDVYSGKKKRYHGTLVNPNSFIQLTSEDESADIIYVFKQREHVYQIRNTVNDGYAICKDGEPYCYLQDPIDPVNLNENTFIVVGNFIYYLSKNGVIRQSLFKSGVLDRGKIIMQDTNYSAIKKVAGCIILLKSGNNPKLTILNESSKPVSIPIVNSIDDMIEWDAKIYIILTIREESFLVSFDTIKDITSSEYLTKEISASLDELINAYRFGIENYPVSYVGGYSSLRFHHTEDQLLIWSPNSDILYRYDGFLFTYWKYELGTDYYTITNVVSSSNRIIIRVETDKQSFAELLYSYDGKSFARYDTMEIKPSKNLLMVKDQFYIFNNDAIFTNNGFARYGYYSVNHIKNSNNGSFYLPNGKPDFLFGFDSKRIIINNRIFHENGMDENISLIKENERYQLNSLLDPSSLDEITLLTVNEFELS